MTTRLRAAAVSLAMLALASSALRAAPALEDQVILQLVLEGDAVKVAAVWKAKGVPTPSVGLDVLTGAPAGSRWFEVLAEGSEGEGEAVLSRGPLPGATVAVEAEHPGDGHLISRRADVGPVPLAIRVPARLAPVRVAVFRTGPGGARQSVARVDLPAASAPPAAIAQPRAIHGDGRSLNRVRLIIAPDGFEADQLRDGELTGKLFDAMRDELFRQPPFDRLGHLLRIDRVDVAATAEGVSMEDGPARSTPFHARMAHLRAGGQVLMEGGDPAYPWLRVESDAEGMNALVALAPGGPLDAVFLLAASPNYTGHTAHTGAPVPFMFSGLGASVPRFVHQLGHALAGLGDEYAVDPPVCEELAVQHANIDLQASGPAVVWRDWIEAGVLASPVAGGLLCNTKWVHPRPECVMGVGDPETTRFCEVCQERLAEAIYDRVSLVESAEPAELDAERAPGAPPTFRVATNATTRQELVTEWWLDREPRPAPASGAAPLTFTPKDLGPGRHVVRVLLADRSPIGVSPPAPAPRVRSFPHEVRWDILVRSAGSVPALPTAGAALDVRAGPP